MRLPEGGAISGWAALRLWGGGFFDGVLDGHTEMPVDLVVPAQADIRRAPSIRRHRSELKPTDLVCRYGIPCTPARRALVDAINWESTPIGRQQIADLALSAQLTTATDALDWMANRTNSRNRRIIAHTITHASDRVLSPQETTLRLLWHHGGLPPLRCNWPVADEQGRYIGRPGLLCIAESVIIEYDGRDHVRDDVRVVDLTKEDAFRRCGLEYIRVINRDLAYPDRITARMHQAVTRSRASGIPRTYRVARHPPPVLRERDTTTGFVG